MRLHCECLHVCRRSGRLKTLGPEWCERVCAGFLKKSENERDSESAVVHFVNGFKSVRSGARERKRELHQLADTARSLGILSSTHLPESFHYSPGAAPRSIYASPAAC